MIITLVIGSGIWPGSFERALFSVWRTIDVILGHVQILPCCWLLRRILLHDRLFAGLKLRHFTKTTIFGSHQRLSTDDNLTAFKVLVVGRLKNISTKFFRKWAELIPESLLLYKLCNTDLLVGLLNRTPLICFRNFQQLDLPS